MSAFYIDLYMDILSRSVSRNGTGSRSRSRSRNSNENNDNDNDDNNNNSDVQKSDHAELYRQRPLALRSITKLRQLPLLTVGFFNNLKPELRLNSMRAV
jgi:hypothetical protein